MGELIISAITIKSEDVKDNDKLIKFFTPKGIILAKARGIKKADAKLKFCSQPFCFSEITLAEKGGFFTLTGALLHDTFFDLTNDLETFGAASTVLETAKLYDNLTAPRGMIEILNSFKSFLKGGTRETLVKYLISCLEIIGYKYGYKTCTTCRIPLVDNIFFDFDNGVVCARCASLNGLKISQTAFNAFRLLTEASYDLIVKYHLNRSALKELITILASALTQKTDLKINSLELLL